VSQLAALGIFFSFFFSSLLNIYLEIGLLTMDSHHTLSAATPAMPAAAAAATVTAIATVVADQQQGARDASRLELLVCLCFLLTSFLLNDG
jgi:hypothetical protein